MKKKIILSSVGGVALVVAAFLFFGGSRKGAEDALSKVKVTKGNIVDKALAVGTIEPENEISIKSKVSGAVSRIFADAGTFVKAGQSLLEVRPDPTPLELAEAKRGVELAEVELDNTTKDKTRQESLIHKQLISTKEYEDFQRKFDEAQLRLSIAKERLALLESGKINVMYVVVKERTREIGIKMAVGARRSYILSQFIFEALLLAFIGGTVGLLFSWGIVSGVHLIPSEDGVMQFLGKPVLSPAIMLLTTGILAAIGFLAGFFPAKRAASVDPVESLRYE